MPEEVFQYRHPGSAPSGRAQAGFFSPAVGLMAAISLISPTIFPTLARTLFASPRRWLILFGMCSLVTALLAIVGLSAGLWNVRRHGWASAGNTTGVVINALVLLALAVVVVRNVTMLR